MRFETPRSVRYIEYMPGNSGVAIFHNAYMKDEFKGKGFGYKENELAMNFAWQQGYRYALCTVNVNNTAQMKIMGKNGWRMLDSYVNTYDQSVVLFGRELCEPQT